jgi:Fur family ferric uptake transcriptional regulator
LTRARRSVLEVLSRSVAPLTVAEIHGRLQPVGTDRVSVYRAVHLMVKEGFLRAADVTRAGVRYELTEAFTGHHHHLVCQACGRIEDLEGCLLEAPALLRLRQRIQRTRRFRVTEHELRLSGYCAGCTA